MFEGCKIIDLSPELVPGREDRRRAQEAPDRRAGGDEAAVRPARQPPEAAQGGIRRPPGRPRAAGADRRRRAGRAPLPGPFVKDEQEDRIRKAEQKNLLRRGGNI